MILSARTLDLRRPLTPWRPRYVENGVSGGLSGASYDVAVAENLVLGSGAFVLASTVEWFAMPLDLAATVHDKSTWARRGLAVQNTFIDPGWEGFLTLELTYQGHDLLRIPPGTPIAQIVFHLLDVPTTGYVGKYQSQASGPTPPRMSDHSFAPFDHADRLCRVCGHLEHYHGDAS